jgi:HEAT repeat protein
MKALISILFAIAMGIVVSPVLGLAQDVKSFVRQVYIEGVPYDEATLFDPATAAPTLLEMLADPSEEEHWPNIVITLGMLGDERAVDPLIRFLEQGIPSQRLSRAHYIAKTGVVMALGYLINQSGSQKALAYLKDSVKPGIWRERNTNWTSPYHATFDARNLQLSKMAILGLALSGQPSAAETLRYLQRPAITEGDRKFQDQVSAVISEALSAYETISREGLMSYDRRRRRR